MDSQLKDLQNACADTEHSLEGLLRKAQSAASEIDDSEKISWIKQELTGYDADASLPAHRLLKGRLALHDAFQGWQILKTDSESIDRKLSQIEIRDPLAELESLLENSQDNEALFRKEVPEDKQAKFREKLGLEADFVFIIEPEQIEKMLQQVRNKIYDWTVKLQQQEKSPDRTTHLELSLQKLEDEVETRKLIGEKLKRLSRELTRKNPDSSAMEKLISDINKIQETID